MVVAQMPKGADLYIVEDLYEGSVTGLGTKVVPTSERREGTNAV